MDFALIRSMDQFNLKALGSVTPRYNWQSDPSKLNITGREVVQKLTDTRPIAGSSMEAGASGMRGRNPDAPAADNHDEHHGHSSDPNSFASVGWQLKEGEDKIIADLLVDIFSAAPKA